MFVRIWNRRLWIAYTSAVAKDSFAESCCSLVSLTYFARPVKVA